MATVDTLIVFLVSLLVGATGIDLGPPVRRSLSDSGKTSRDERRLGVQHTLVVSGS